ncbi:MAG: SH3 domain-containing protein [Candidatus Dormibacteria bacterium]
MKPRLPPGLPALAALVLVACSSNGNSTTFTGPAAPTAAPSASAGFIRAIWVLSPVGLSLRDNADSAAKPLTTVPQGTQLTATEFRAGTPGWYHVSYNGVTGWVADKDIHSSPPQALVTARAQLAYSNPGAGYYFLYPSTWSVNERGSDVGLDAPPPDGSGTPQPQVSGQAPLAGVTPDKLVIHVAPAIDQLGPEPTTSGAGLDTADFEVGGVTAVKRTFSLSGGGYEGDVKVRYTPDHAVLITMRTAVVKNLEIFTEVLESFGFSLKAAASPSPSP